MLYVVFYSTSLPLEFGTWRDYFFSTGLGVRGMFINHIGAEILRPDTSWVLCLERHDTNEGFVFVASSEQADWRARLKVCVPINWKEAYSTALPESSLLADDALIGGNIYPAAACIWLHASMDADHLIGPLPRGLAYRLVGQGEDGKVFTLAAGAESSVRAFSGQCSRTALEGWKVQPLILMRP